MSNERLPFSALPADVLLKHNLGNLKLHDPQLHYSLQNKVYQPHYHIHFPASVDLPYCVTPVNPNSPQRGENGIIHPVNPMQEAKQYVDQLEWQNDSTLIVINTGLGFIARELGERLFLNSFLPHPKQRLIFVEEDLDLFRHSLMLHNWDVNFWQPQVKWIAGTSIKQLHQHPFFQEHPNIYLNALFIINGGILSQREKDETAYFQNQWLEQSEKQNHFVHTQFSSLLIRKKNLINGDKKRVLFLNINQQRELQKSIVQTFRRWGWDCSMVAPKSHPQYGHHVYGFYSQWTWFHALQDFNADYIFLINHIPPDTEMDASLSKLHIPIIVWYWDDPNRDRDFPSMHGKDTSHYFIFCYDKSHLNFVKEKGYENVFYMPAGTVMSPDIVNRNVFNKHNGVTYVGSLMTGEAIMNNRVLAVHFPEWHVWLQTSLMEIQQGKWKDEMECLQHKPFPKDQPSLTHCALVTYLQDALTNHFRTSVLERMTKHNLHTYGGKDLLSDSCSAAIKQAYQVRRVKYHEELPALYAQSAVNLNLNHSQTKEGIAQRIYDCLAVGGFIITDNNPAITETFIHNNEIVCADSIDEMDELAAYYLSHPNERETIIQQGQKNVLLRHTLDKRLKDILYQVNLD